MSLSYTTLTNPKPNPTAGERPGPGRGEAAARGQARALVLPGVLPAGVAATLPGARGGGGAVFAQELRVQP